MYYVCKDRKCHYGYLTMLKMAFVCMEFWKDDGNSKAVNVMHNDFTNGI